jgi:uncharacterized protein YgiM (DUF1202 family)
MSWLAAFVLIVSFHIEPAEGKKNSFVDPCASASKELKTAEGSVSRLFVERSLIGGILGAGAGLLLSKGTTEGALKGALIGAAAGAASAYLESKKRASSDRRALAGSVYQDVANANSEAARALRSFTQARNCRVGEALRIKGTVARGELTREAGTAQLAEHKKRLERDIKLAEKFAKDYEDALGNFRTAAGYLAEGRSNDQLYLEQFTPAQSAVAPPPAIYAATTALTVRTSASAKAAAVSKLSRGESVELLSQQPGGWHEIRRSDGSRGFVASRYLAAAAPSAPARVRLSQVSPEVRTVAQPMFEGMEKRGAIDAELRVARANASNETFSL